MDELLARHRKEARDLQSRITQKKKQASKKTRKGVNDECDRLEAELKQRQSAEVAALSGEIGDLSTHNVGEEPVEQLEDLTLHSDEDNAVTSTAEGHNDGFDVLSKTASGSAAQSTQPKKGNRQKARLARRAQEQEALVRQAEEEAQNLPDLKEQERERMLEAMKQHSLCEKEIRADGHCLYSAVADQLEQLDIPIGSAPSDQASLKYKLVRAKAADYIEQNADDFTPFLEEPLPDYLHKIRETGEWGGQLELMALAKTYGTNINVLQDFGRVEKIESGSSDSSKTMWLGYYKHGFGLGEHYNSLRKAK